jgi:dihydrolipoamide dehydrogenase
MGRLDIAVVGSGPGGYIAALRAAQLGMKVALVERAALGGVCLNRGCIPTIAMRQAAIYAHHARKGAALGVFSDNLRVDYPALLKRRDRVVARLRGGVQSLLRHAGVQVHYGTAQLAGPHTLHVTLAPGGKGGAAVPGPPAGELLLETEYVLLASGSRPIPLSIPGGDLPGVIDSDGGLALREIPRRLLVVGAGAIGCEWSMNFARLGSGVTLVEIGPSILPLEEPEVSAILTGRMLREGMAVRSGTSPAAIEQTARGLRVHLAGAEETEVEVDQVLVAAGRAPRPEQLNLAAAGLTADAEGFVPVDERCRTAAPSVLALGDLTGLALRSHVAARQGVIAVESAAGLEPKPIRTDRMPLVTYSDPEVASVGLREGAAREGGLDVVTGTFSLSASGRAIAMAEDAGLVKVVSERSSGRLLGAHMVGPHAGELIGQAVTALELGATLDDLASMLRSHPTLWENLGEAALAAMGRPLHGA